MRRKIAIEDLQIGMVFSKPLYTSENNALIPAGVALKEADYNRLVRWGIKELYTEGELVEVQDEYLDDSIISELSDDETINLHNVEYMNNYTSCLSFFEQFIETYLSKEEFDKPKLEEIIKKLLELIENYKNDIISYMGVEKEEYDFLITHSINSTIIALIGGIQLKLDKSQLRHLGMAGLLHDIGMLKIPKVILNKKGKLNDEEYNLIKSHPITAFKEMNRAGIFNQVVLDAVLQHQEQFDGNGYPRKLKGDKIGLYARILAIADSFEAQISPRAYRESTTSYMAMKTVLAEAHNKFDPKVLRAFLTTLSIYPPGTLLQLNDNSISTVMSINPDAPLRPNVKIVIDSFGEKIKDKIVKNLKEESELFIVRVLNRNEYNKNDNNSL